MKKHAVRVAEFADAAQVAVRRHDDAAFALHRLDDERRRAGQRTIERVEIAEGDVAELGDERLERIFEEIATGGGEAAHRLAVIGVVGRDDHRALRREPRGLERGFDRFGAAVREETDLQVARRDARELFGERGGLRVEEHAR